MKRVFLIFLKENGSDDVFIKWFFQFDFCKKNVIEIDGKKSEVKNFYD